MRFIFSPITGVALKPGEEHTDDYYRNGDREWLFNPWTGRQRRETDLRDDPQGLKMLEAERVDSAYLHFGNLTLTLNHACDLAALQKLQRFVGNLIDSGRYK